MEIFERRAIAKLTRAGKLTMRDVVRKERRAFAPGERSHGRSGYDRNAGKRAMRAEIEANR